MEAWDAMIEASATKLMVIDVHLDWCGPCAAMASLFQQVLSSSFSFLFTSSSFFISCKIYDI
jgi:thiol-disulfide isomerase/thioredoxin